jgi:hypothetical protein
MPTELQAALFVPRTIQDQLLFATVSPRGNRPMDTVLLEACPQTVNEFTQPQIELMKALRARPCGLALCFVCEDML